MKNKRKYLLVMTMIILCAFNLHAQKGKNEFIGEYKFYSIKEDSAFAFKADTAENPIGKELDEAIRKSYFRITPDSLLIIDGTGRKKGVRYVPGKEDKELLITENGTESKARYYFDKDKLFLFMKEGESNMEFILTRK